MAKIAVLGIDLGKNVLQPGGARRSGEHRLASPDETRRAPGFRGSDGPLHHSNGGILWRASFRRDFRRPRA
jgi:hypothetical protein